MSSASLCAASSCALKFLFAFTQSAYQSSCAARSLSSRSLNWNWFISLDWQLKGGRWWEVPQQFSIIKINWYQQNMFAKATTTDHKFAVRASSAPRLTQRGETVYWDENQLRVSLNETKPWKLLKFLCFWQLIDGQSLSLDCDSEKCIPCWAWKEFEWEGRAGGWDKSDKQQHCHSTIDRFIDLCA